MRHTIRLATVTMAVALLAAACSNVGEGIANQVLGDQGITIDGESVTIEGPDGTITTGTGLPSTFPADFPLPAGAEPQGSVTGTQGADIVVSLVVEGSVADGTAFFTQALPDAGYAITSELSGPDRTNTVFEIAGGGYTGRVVLNPQGAHTLIAVTLDEAPR